VYPDQRTFLVLVGMSKTCQEEAYAEICTYLRSCGAWTRKISQAPPDAVFHSRSGTRGKRRDPPIRNPCSVSAAGTPGGPKDSSLRRSDLDAHVQGKAARDPDAARLGYLGAAGSWRHPGMRGA